MTIYENGKKYYVTKDHETKKITKWEVLTKKEHPGLKKVKIIMYKGNK